MQKLGLLLVKGIDFVVKYLPAALLASAVIFMFNTVHQDQRKILQWQKQHGQHSVLTRKAFADTEKRLKATDKALDRVQATLYKTSLIIQALRASAKTVDKVRDAELEKLYRRAQLLKEQFGMHKTAAELENTLLRRELKELKTKIKYYERVQRITK